jgi:hypothetical protein
MPSGRRRDRRRADVVGFLYIWNMLHTMEIAADHSRRCTSINVGGRTSSRQRRRFIILDRRGGAGEGGRPSMSCSHWLQRAGRRSSRACAIQGLGFREGGAR